MMFLISSGTMIFLLPENVILFFGRKMKDDLSQKLHGKWCFMYIKYIEIWYFLQMFWKDGLSKRNHTGIWSFLYHQEIRHLFLFWCFLHIRKIWYFFFLQTLGYSTVKKIKNILLPKNALKDDISSITEKDDTHPRKYDIGTLEWHSTKHSNDSLYFYGEIFGCFHILLSNQKIRKLSI